MRFSAVAVSAAVFGVAMALPGVVYETSVVTITSCSPEKTNCPGKVHPTSSYSPPPPPPPITPSCPSPTGHTYPHGNNTYIQPIPSVKPSTHIPSSNCPGYPNCPSPTKIPIASQPSSGYPTYVPTGSGVPHPPKNTSAPVAPSTPPTWTGAASVQSFSFLAVGVAVAAFFL